MPSTHKCKPYGLKDDLVAKRMPSQHRAIQQRLNKRPTRVLSGATPQEAYAAEINMQ